jgi:hypothetical protein
MLVVLEKSEVFGESARQKVLKNYTEEVIVKKHLTFYQDCLEHV